MTFYKDHVRKMHAVKGVQHWYPQQQSYQTAIDATSSTMRMQNIYFFTLAKSKESEERCERKFSVRDMRHPIATNQTLNLNAVGFVSSGAGNVRDYIIRQVAKQLEHMLRPTSPIGSRSYK
jgi:CO dehydrogenase/acetyl-CoA synthase alpha subunit